MAQPKPDLPNLAERNRLFTLSQNGAATAWLRRFGEFNLTIYGEFNAIVEIERSFDGGETAHNVTRPDFQPNAFNTPVSLVLDEPEEGVVYRARVVSYASGPVMVRFSQ